MLRFTADVLFRGARAACWLALCGGLLASGCSRPSAPAADAVVDLQIEPSPPKVGQAEIVLHLTESSGEPLEGGTLEVEGNMNHAGMKPVFATLTETEPGRYAGNLEFTMAGDWFLLVTGQLADGRAVNEKIDVPGVQRP